MAVENELGHPAGRSGLAVSGAAHSVDSFAGLRAIGIVDADIVYVGGGGALNDGGEGTFYRDSGDTASPDDNAMCIVDVNSARWKRQYLGAVKNSWFGAKNDRVTDDTAANQAAINYCLSFPQAKPLRITGSSLVTASMMIDRQVDTTSGDFVIIGDGAYAGFYTKTAITLIDSTIAMPGDDPVSEFVTFHRVHFEASSNAYNAFVLSKKFLRVQFLTCTWEKIACANMVGAYAQTFRFLNNRIRRWAGYFLSSTGSYDIDFSGNIAEAGGPFFRSVDSTGNRGTVGNRFIGNLYEASSGSFIEASVVLGLEISGNYFEGNSGHTLDLTAVGFGNYGIELSGNSIQSLGANIANPNFYEVKWGNTGGCASNGNYCTGRLHDQSAMNGYALDANGDVAAKELIRGNASGITDAARSGISGRFRGYDATAHMEFVAAGQNWVGLDGVYGGIAVTPGVVNGSRIVPVRFFLGAVNPQTNPNYYGNNPFWAAGSRVSNSAPAVGQPKGWICTASGSPGTWVSEGNL